MKLLALFILFPFSLMAAPCPEALVVYGETSSYDKVDGRVELVKEDFKLPYQISEHIGQFKNLKFKSAKKLIAIEVLGKKIALKKHADLYETTDFSLFKLLNEKKVRGKFEIKVHGSNNFSCSTEHEVIGED